MIFKHGSVSLFVCLFVPVCHVLSISGLFWIDQINDGDDDDDDNDDDDDDNDDDEDEDEEEEEEEEEEKLGESCVRGGVL